MSFSSEVKEELSKLENLKKKENVKQELIGYLLSCNTGINKNKIKFSTESEYNINRLGKLLSNCGITEYKIEIQDKNYIITLKIRELEEKLDVAQGKLVLGLDVLKNEPNSRFAICLYNVILGESANSKLFQNVREKASLAYTAGSSYIRQKANIFIRAGIEIENKDKALEITKQQLEAMKQGDFSDEDIDNAKKYMVNGIKSVKEGQDTEITYYMGQELSGLNTSLEEYQKQIEAVTKEDIIEVANKVEINTIYFLRN